MSESSGKATTLAPDAAARSMYARCVCRFSSTAALLTGSWASAMVMGVAVLVVIFNRLAGCWNGRGLKPPPTVP